MTTACKPEKLKLDEFTESDIPETTKCKECGTEIKLDWGTSDLSDIACVAGLISSMICGKCSDKQEKKEIAEAKKQKQERLLRLSRIPDTRIHWERDKGNYELMSWVWKNREQSLFIADDYDTGKTWTVCAVGFKLMHDIKLQYWNCNDLLYEYISHAQESMVACKNFLDSLLKNDLLIIDDLGKKTITESGCDCLYSVVNKFYEADKKLWLTANLSGDGLIRRFKDKDTGNAVVSRLKRMCIDWSANKENV